jgi:hypothetical protein
MIHQCQFDPSMGEISIRCPKPAVVYVENDIGAHGWYCAEHAAFFAEQARNRAAIARWFKRLLHFGAA